MTISSPEFYRNLTVRVTMIKVKQKDYSKFGCKNFEIPISYMHCTLLRNEDREVMCDNIAHLKNYTCYVPSKAILQT